MWVDIDRDSKQSTNLKKFEVDWSASLKRKVLFKVTWLHVYKNLLLKSRNGLRRKQTTGEVKKKPPLTFS